eukprot:1158637-Pelagomonas_calceolata.AAC.8
MPYLGQEVHAHQRLIRPGQPREHGQVVHGSLGKLQQPSRGNSAPGLDRAGHRMSKTTIQKSESAA